MLKKERLIKSITRQIILLKDYLRATNKISLTDGSRIIQPIIAELYNTVNDTSLIDLDIILTNHPAIDLGDSINGICIQISSNIDSKKIKETISMILTYEYYKDYPKLRFFDVGQKQKRYTINSFDKNKILFDPSSDILDWDDLLKQISSCNVAKLECVEKLLGDHIELNEVLESPIDDGDGIHMIFKDINSFEEWNNHVSFSLGLPKISFNVQTGKANYSHVIEKYTECFASYIPGDNRVCAKADQNLNHKFLNEEAQKRYLFRLANFTEMEEAGFYKDFQLEINYQYEIHLPNFIYSKPTEFNICLDRQHLFS